MKWKLIVTLSVLVVIASFSLIFTPHVIAPRFLSMPYILWTGILSTAVLVLLTYLGAEIFPKANVFSDLDTNPYQ